MRVTFEYNGSIVDIGTNLSLGGLDSSGLFASSDHGKIGVAVYERDIADQLKVSYRAGFYMKPSEARAMASALLSAATESKG